MELEWDGGDFSGKGLEHLAKLKKLTRLDLRETKVTDAELAHLKGMTQLEWLSLPEKISDEGMRHLAELVNLESLYLTKTGITDEGLKHLHKMTKLQEVRLNETKVTDMGVENLKKTLPGANIVK